MANKIFLLEDEEDICFLIKHNLEKEGFKVTTFLNPNDFLQVYKKEHFDLLLLDLMLPDMGGLEILKIIKSDPEKKDLPVIILTAKNTEFDKVIGLELGADDYITKPFSINELIARVKAILRRLKKESTDKSHLKYKEIKLYTSSFNVYIEDKKIDLTKTEFLILKLMLSNIGKVLSRDFILDSLWGNEKIVIDRTIDVHINKLRNKLGKYGDYIKTIRGVGYIFEGNDG